MVIRKKTFLVSNSCSESNISSKAIRGDDIGAAISHVGGILGKGTIEIEDSYAIGRLSSISTNEINNSGDDSGFALKQVFIGGLTGSSNGPDTKIINSFSAPSDIITPIDNVISFVGRGLE